MQVHQITCTLFTSWFVLSVFFQFRKLSAKMSRYDPLGLLPRWTFFAPNPGIYDYHIVYRAIAGEDTKVNESFTATSWQNIQIFRASSAIPFLWNPERRVSKTVSDATNSIIGVLRQSTKGQDLVCYTPAYFLITHLAQRATALGTKIEWAIVRSHGFRGDRVISPVFVSNVHEVA
jgi:hypothetical protein